MATALPRPAFAAAPPSYGQATSLANANVWRSPLVGVALALTTGIVLDRYLSLPLAFSLLTAGTCLLAWLAARTARHAGLPLLYLALTGVAVGAAYHHWYAEVYPADDIGHFVTTEARPARLRGVIEEEPIISRQPLFSPLQSHERTNPTFAVVRVTELRQDDAWIPVSGRVRLVVTAELRGLHVGDRIETVGRLAAPHGPGNPGEGDYAAVLHDQRIRAQMVLQEAPEGVTRLAEGWRWSFFGHLAVLRGWGQDVMRQSLGSDVSGLAMALLLGEGSTLTREDWQKYVRTGVIHILAISGQHLVVLALFIGGILRLLAVRRRTGGILVALLLLSYALLVGGRPPVLRSAVTVCATCLGFALHRSVLPANCFALAWLVVALLNPLDGFNTGCQLSFLAVALLYWGPGHWLTLARYPLNLGLMYVYWAMDPRLPLEKDPLDGLLHETRPLWQKGLLWVGRQVFASYVIALFIWLLVAPLVAARYHLVSPLGIVIGPPLTVLTSIALVGGFLLLLAAAVCPPLICVFAWGTQGSLRACTWIVDVADALPGGSWYVGTIPEWWVWIFYVALLALLTQKSLQRPRRWAVPIGVAWFCVGLLSGSIRPSSDALRCTFLAVGHGGCTVLETPDGRTLLYDAGALAGPDVTRLRIAPFLWHRGIRRLDEVFLSHADLDHFNGLPALLERFVVGQVTCTPSFAEKTTPGVRETLAAIERHAIPTRVVHAGDRLSAGEVEIEVLHPPARGPEGTENARSLVLLVRHAGHSLLLTGDLEGPGMERVLALPPLSVDILMAPHHGSRTANTPELATWGRPKVVVSCEGPPRGPKRAAEPYSERGAQFLGTWLHGAIAIQSRENELVVETFQSGQRFVVQP